MYTLKFKAFSVSVTDYCRDNSLLALDIDLESESSIQSFLNYYKDHMTNSTSIDYELDGTTYHGHFGLFVFDNQCKARVYMTTKPDDFESSGGSYGIFNKNVISILNNHKSALKTIVDSLKRNNMLDESEISFLSECLPNIDYGNEMYQKVYSLEDYLTITKCTLDNIRNS